MKKTVSTTVLVMVMIATGGMIAAAMPQIPESYWGYAILNDKTAPIGTQVTVEVYGTGEAVGSSTIQYEEGLYVMKVMIDDPASPEDEGAENGDPLTWKLNGIECSTPAPGTDTAQSGGINNNFSLIASSPIFDTGPGGYPSIFGVHKGTITPNQTMTVHKVYTYPCPGTGGHTEYVWIHGNGLNESASWNGYSGDWHNISFSEPLSLEVNKTYNYTIVTGSYPLIHHTDELEVACGIIRCTEFVDANRKVYNDWIPAIRLYF